MTGTFVRGRLEQDAQRTHAQGEQYAEDFSNPLDNHSCARVPSAMERPMKQGMIL
jgi:hypothetical protein